jgi:hypothetical protein
MISSNETGRASCLIVVVAGGGEGGDVGKALEVMPSRQHPVDVMIPQAKSLRASFIQQTSNCFLGNEKFA